MCRFFLWFFGVLYFFALSLFIIGEFGLFGSPSGSLSGIFLVPLGLPWNLFLDNTPEAMRPWLAAAAPIINLVILRLICGKSGAS